MPVLFEFVPPEVAMVALGLALGVGMVVHRPRPGQHSPARPRPDERAAWRLLRRLLPRRPRRPGPRSTRISVAELVERGLDEWPLAGGVFLPDEDQGLWCYDCLADPAARGTLARLYPRDRQATILFGLDASVLAKRMCDYPGHVRQGVA